MQYVDKYVDNIERVNMNKIDIENKIKNAMDNSIYKDKPFVIGDGLESAKVMLVGEAPGAEEEKHGKPFIGKAGKILTEFLEGIDLSREELYISNVVKIRPSKINSKTGNLNNRPPNKDEVNFFLPFLFDEIDMVSPKVVVTLGGFALCALTGDNGAKIGDYHGEPIEVNGRKVFPLYHPASIIYNRALQPIYDEDLGKLKEFLKN